MEAIDVFYPVRMAERILGMGDVVSLKELKSSLMKMKPEKITEKDC
jgi:signal recognition particle GTPase